ncbi:unnamed protein product [Phytophthora fragariaefolia]|uniref:Unnamed protein product n=1 Tax=Phytophthora fragariaefolia TaxID=1490495 RepID=A0A9W7CS17_9STRA|nr:unnamed protein product [Phytophthora fragariaefolia]
MVALSLCQLPPEELHAGDTIAYYSWAFVCGDPRGYRESVVLSVDSSNAEGRTIQVDTGEAVAPTMKLKRLVDRNGHHCTDEEAKWRSMRSFRLVDGTYNASMRSSTFKSGLRRAIEAAFASVMGTNTHEREDMAKQQSPVSLLSVKQTDADVSLSSTIGELQPTAATSGVIVTTTTAATACERLESNVVVIDVEADEVVEAASATSTANSQPDAGSDTNAPGQGGDVSEETSSKPPTDVDLAAMSEYLKSIPTRWERAACKYTMPSHWWQKNKTMLRLPGIKERLRSLHFRRPQFEEPRAPADPIEAEVPWPGNVKYLEECEVPEGIEFADIGDGHSCKCLGDCFMDTCCNAALAIFCTPECCALNASCSNAPRTRKTLKLYDTGRVGLGVFTTTFLEVGDVVGEYTGRLCAYSALVVGQPAQAMKQNSGYTMLLNERAVNGKFVYIEALNCGSITRFMSHACDPNVAFVEMQNRTTVKVMAVMIKSVKAGAQLTVNYGNQIWFQCSCDDCGLGRSDGSRDSVTSRSKERGDLKK